MVKAAVQHRSHLMNPVIRGSGLRVSPAAQADAHLLRAALAVAPHDPNPISGTDPAHGKRSIVPPRGSRA